MQVENAREHEDPNHEVTESGPKNALDITPEEAHSSSHVSCNKVEDSSGSLDGGGFPEDLGIVDNVEQKFSDKCYDLSKECSEFRSRANDHDETNILSSVMAADQSSYPIANNEDSAAVLVDEKLKVLPLNELEPDDTNILSSVMAEEQSSLPIANNEDSAAVLVDEKLKVLSLNELDDPITEEGESSFEDDSTFLEALHDGEDSLHPESSSGFEIEPVEEGRTAYDPSVWNATEIATATGSEDCLVLEHKLKLKSTYTEVEVSCLC